MKHSFGRSIKAANVALLTDCEEARIAEFFSAAYLVHTTGGDEMGHDAIRRYLGMLHRAFPVLKVEVEILLEGDDRVTWQRTLSGIQRGAFHAFPASGRRVRWREMVTSRFQDGLIVEEWLVSDLAESLLRARKQPQRPE